MQRWVAQALGGLDIPGASRANQEVRVAGEDARHISTVKYCPEVGEGGWEGEVTGALYQRPPVRENNRRVVEVRAREDGWRGLGRAPIPGSRAGPGSGVQEGGSSHQEASDETCYSWWGR